MKGRTILTLLTSGISKAAGNWALKRISIENKDMIAFALHPGWVATDMVYILLENTVIAVILTSGLGKCWCCWNWYEGCSYLNQRFC